MATGKERYKVNQKSGSSKSPSSHSNRNSFNKNPKKSSGGVTFRTFVPFILFVLALLLVLSFFLKDFGFIGNAIRDLFFGLFSISLYVLPVYLAIIGYMMITDKAANESRGRVICFALSFLLIDIGCHVFFAADGTVKSCNPFEHFKYGVDKQGGGFVGGFFGGLLVKCFSRIGAIIIFAAALTAVILILVRKTPKEAWNQINGSYQANKDRRRALKEERAEALRIENERLEAERLEAEKLEEQRLEAERQKAIEEYGFGDYPPIDTGIFDEALFEGERRTEFDPSITDEDFPINHADEAYAEDNGFTEFADADDTFYEELDPVAESADPEYSDMMEDGAVFGESDEEVLERLSKAYLDAPLEVGHGKISSFGEDVVQGEDSQTAGNKPEAPKYVFPKLEFLSEDTDKKDKDYTKELRAKESKLIETLEKFNVHTQSAGLPSKGPTITRYELRPAPGTRVRTIVNLVDDIALSLATSGIRIEAPIPGKSAVGIEVPNDESQIVKLRTLIDSPAFRDAQSRLNVALGEDVAGAPIYFDISKMPHLLIAGATGMGKSVCINCLIVSLLYKASPEEVKLILVDPKKVEFNMYSDLPHLIVPVVSDPKKAAGALSWAVNEMERRFCLIEGAKVRNITGYNEIAEKTPDMAPLPHIVIIIDELADLMMTAPDSVEDSIARLAQKARAAGMHLIIGTQRPSVDVITGTIKNNIPSRIACKVSSQIDSRTIIDVAGAEKLLGRGDMLFNPVGAIKPIRVQGAFVKDSEIENIVDYIKQMNTAEQGYSDDVMAQIETEAAKCSSKKHSSSADEIETASDGNEDPMFWKAVELAVESGKISTSLIQRKCSLGFGRAAKLIDRMEELGYVSAPDGQKPRQVRITAAQLQQIKMGASPSVGGEDDDGSDADDDFGAF